MGFWFAETNLEKVFFAFAVTGGTFFAFRAVSLFLGFGGEDAAADASAGADAADAADAGAADSDGSPGGDFKLFTLNGIVSFAFLFGLTGWLLLRDGVSSPFWASVAAVAVGSFSAWATAKIFQCTRRLQTDGTVRLQDAVGETGEVYLAIRPGATGQVRVTARGQSKIFDAGASDPAAEIPTGSRVKVESVSGNALVVSRISA